MRDLSKGKDVLDTYCYSGGFSINAALGGAKSVTSVDSSAAAVSALLANMKLNQGRIIYTIYTRIKYFDDFEYLLVKYLVPIGVEVVKADAIEYMQHLAKEGKKYDIVVCDPPKLAPSRNNKYSTK